MKDKEFLEHFGIPGMHWGRKKGSTKPTTKNKSAKNDMGSPEHNRKNILKKKSLKDMTNDELKEYTTRLQLEKQYKDLRKTDSIPGKKFVADFLEYTAKQALTTYATKQLGELMKKIIK